MSFSFGNVFMGLIGVAIGIFLIVKAYYLNHHVYFLDWAERKWGQGSGTTFYRVAGMILCFFSLFVIAGWIDLFGSSFGQSQTRANQNETRSIRRGNTINRITE